MSFSFDRSTSLLPALESQLQALHQAAATATTAVNARGTTLNDRLHDIPYRTREVAGHGVRQGAAVALAMVQILLGHELHNVQLVFLEGEARVDF